MRLLLALLAATSFAEVTISPPEGTCEVEGAIACLELRPGESLARVTTEGAARYVLEAEDGEPLLSGPVPADGFVALPPGARRLVVY